MLVLSMADQMFTTTAQMDNSILNVVEGKVLDIPNGSDSILLASELEPIKSKKISKKRKKSR